MGLFFSSFSHAQKKNLPVTVSAFNQATSMPFSKFFTAPIHPGLAISSEFNYSKAPKRSRLFQTLGGSYYYHRYLNQAITFFSELGYEFRTKPGVEIAALLGVGYMCSFRTATEYSFKNGSYTSSKNGGVGRFTPSFSLETGYYLFPEKQTSPKLFARYQVWVEYPFSPDFIDLMPHTNVHLGIKFLMGSNNQQ
ncbi:hypothetical protein [Flexibacter flexilis]|nr:hypothetical protein [Flexibacter flexilis]